MYVHTCTLYTSAYCIVLYITCMLQSITLHALYLVSAGRSSMKQYMPQKPVKRGFKVWVRADAVNGYFCDFNVYVGRPADGISVETGRGARVVKQLTEHLQGKNYQIFCDNFFSSCNLFADPLHHNIYACGTTRTNRRGYPDTLKGVTLERGKQVFCQQGNLVASVWMDKKPVTMLSTLAQPNIERTAYRKQKDGTRLSVQCSDSVVLYNKYMGGVDRGDQMRQYYRVRSKCLKNYILYSTHLSPMHLFYPVQWRRKMKFSRGALNYYNFAW